jgi:uncharacterized protein YndB with AHSA1/START domain
MAQDADQARVSVLVAVPRELAFRIFTEEIDLWWRRGAQYRMLAAGRGIVHLEPRLGGRLYESLEVGSDMRVVEAGRVTHWEPPARMTFEWRARNFAPHETTEVEVAFEASRSGTLVTVVHRGWSQIRTDHPVRHGLEPTAFVRMMGLWWGDLMSALRLHVASRPQP